MKALKAFIKPIEAPQRSGKLKFNLSFISIQLSEMHGTLKVNKVKNFNFTNSCAELLGKGIKRESNLQTVICPRNPLCHVK